MIGAVLAEYNDEWMISRIYMSLEVLEKAQHMVIDESEEEEEGELVEQIAA